MTFPQTPLDIQVDLQIDGAWTEITSDVYRRDSIVISRGRQNEEGQHGPGRCELTLNNRSGKYSPRNPTGTYYGKIGRNTPIRVSVNHGTPYLSIADTSGDKGTTADHASLDITGDIDVRIEAILDDWYTTDDTFLMGKYESGNESWYLSVAYGRLTLGWTTGGTFVTETHENSTVTVTIPGTRRLAVRATLDADNGSGGHTVTFYTSDSISGTWTQLGDAVTTAGTTSIYSGSASLDVGYVGSGFSTFGPVGQILAAEVRNGIGGSVVANPNWEAQAAGATSFADGAGRTWTLAGNATITNRQTRFVGEVTSWPTRWDTSGQDVYTPIEASGILRRLGQGEESLQSAMRREFGSPSRLGIPYGGTGEVGIVAYWPCEDGSEATVLASAHAGDPPMTYTGSISRAAYSDWGASDALPTLGSDSVVTGLLPTYTVTTFVGARCFFYLPQAVGAEATLFDVVTTGTAKTWTVRVTTAGDLILRAYDADVVSILTSSTLTAGINGSKVQISLELEVSGSDTVWTMRSFDLDNGVVESTLSGTLASRTFDRVTEVRVGATYGLSGAAFGHFVVSSDAAGFAGTAGAIVGNAGEAASTRIARIAGEENIPLVLISRGDDEPVGPQRIGTVLQLMRDAADVGHGILYEARHVSALQYRGLPSYYNQTPAATLAYSTDLMPPLEPTDDDQLLRNAVSVQRVDGVVGTAVETEGPLSVLSPPDGAGRYGTQVTRNLYTDDQPAQHAAWYVHVGTVDEFRYPVVRVAVQAQTSIAQQVMALDCGNRLLVTDPSSKLPPGDIDLIVEGYRETMAQFEWDFELNCSPASPYTVITLDDDDLGRLDTDGSVLGTAATSSATTLVVHTTQTTNGMVPIWTEAAGDYPLDLRVGGEVVTASAATSLAADTFTRTVAAGGWGTSSDSHTYTLTGGSASDRSVSATYGLVTLPSAPTTIRFQTVAETCQDVEVRAGVAVSATATGASLVAGIVFRYVDSTNYYRVRTEFTTAGGITLTLTRGTTVIGSGVSTGVTYSAGSVIEVRVRVIGHRVLARAWATGGTEPATWHLDQTVSSSTISEGLVGLAASGLTGNTNVSPQIRFHDWLIETPQRFTVTRSVNGVNKAQVAGEDIRLATPSILAL